MLFIEPYKQAKYKPTTLKQAFERATRYTRASRLDDCPHLRFRLHRYSFTLDGTIDSILNSQTIFNNCINK